MQPKMDHYMFNIIGIEKFRLNILLIRENKVKVFHSINIIMRYRKSKSLAPLKLEGKHR